VRCTNITGAASNNLRFPGQYFLIEAGLHYNWHRHYDPTLGRYLQPDPLGLEALLSDGPSTYGYVGQSPAMYIDPTGQQKWKRVGDLLSKIAEACIVAWSLWSGSPDMRPPRRPRPPPIERPLPPRKPTDPPLPPKPPTGSSGPPTPPN
jgi:RHS repeat-associated protein